MGVMIGMLVLSVLLIAGPVVASTLEHPLGTLVSAVLVITGVIFGTISVLLMVVTKLYVKTKANEAFVRTGQGGMRVVKDGGALVIPVIHQIIKVTLDTFKLQVERVGSSALITADKLRADIKAEFYVRVPPDDDNIMQAARSLGEKMMNIKTVKELVDEKLVSALRTVAAKKTLEELNSNRDEFMAEVIELISQDLESNGLMLETATISSLDQADPKALDPNNIFDAQGLRTIASITQEQLTQKNLLERRGEQERKGQDVETAKAILTLQRQEEEARAVQEAEVAKVRYQQESLAAQTEIATSQAVKLADIEKQRVVLVQEQERSKSIEVAERAKEKAVAEAQAQRAKAEALLADAEAERERSRQQIETVKAVEQANRSKQQMVIKAEADAEMRFVSDQRGADAEAYRLEKEADGKKAAADAEAEAVRKNAEAQRDASIARAEGERAHSMVPVDVASKQVEVKRNEAMIQVDVASKQLEIDRQRVEDVLTKELEARAASGQVAQEFELEKLRIEQTAIVRIETARAAASLLNKVNAKIFGTPEDVQRMVGSVLSGMGLAEKVDGFVEAIQPTVLKAIEGVTGTGQGEVK